MNNDLISREALKEAMRKAKRGHYAAFSDVTLQGIYRVIDNAPTVDTNCPHCDSGYAQGYSDGYLKGKEDRPQGEWIEESTETGALGIKYTWVRCNQCGWDNSLVIPKNFCPNCGADMRGKKHD